MRSLSIALSESQLEHLREIKKTHGISMAAFIRVLLKADIERPLIPEYAVVDERSEVTTATKRRVVIHRGPISPERSALMAELNTALERRRKKVDEAIVASAVRAI
jgi:hypothetical protein